MGEGGASISGRNTAAAICGQTRGTAKPSRATAPTTQAPCAHSPRLGCDGVGRGGGAAATSGRRRAVGGLLYGRAAFYTRRTSTPATTKTTARCLFGSRSPHGFCPLRLGQGKDLGKKVCRIRGRSFRRYKRQPAGYRRNSGFCR